MRVLGGEEELSSASAEELRVLERVGAPPSVRLACQAIPSGDISIVPLPPPNASVRDTGRRSPSLAGQERDIAILFADLRSLTQFSEKKPPYDVVFVVNRYFTHMGEAVEAAGGHLDKFIGDAIMAGFGVPIAHEDDEDEMMRRRGTFTNTYKERERHSCHITYYRTYTLTYSNSSSHRGGHTHSHIQVHKVEDTLTHALTRTLTHALTHTLIYTLTHTLTHMEEHGGMVKHSHSLTRSHADTP